jgi:hypothetical protein
MDSMHDRDRVAARLGAGNDLAMDGRAPRDGMSNPAPGGSARKSAAIIPFVNEGLTSGGSYGLGPELVNEFRLFHPMMDGAGATELEARWPKASGTPRRDAAGFGFGLRPPYITGHLEASE